MTREQLLEIAKPILFNTEMVRAILEGRKTVTRRIIKPQPTKQPHKTGGGRFLPPRWAFPTELEDCVEIHQPFHIGEILYVRETWNKYEKRVGKGNGCHIEQFYGYKASPACSEVYNQPWKPSIHMPKKAARIFLKVTDIRAERLQDITTEQCIYEGVEKEALEVGNEFVRGMFSDIWDSTIKKQDLNKYSWQANPWVWVIELERIEQEV